VVLPSSGIRSSCATVSNILNRAFSIPGFTTWLVMGQKIFPVRETHTPKFVISADSLRGKCYWTMVSVVRWQCTLIDVNIGTNSNFQWLCTIFPVYNLSIIDIRWNYHFRNPLPPIFEVGLFPSGEWAAFYSNFGASTNRDLCRFSDLWQVEHLRTGWR
jgi:hypothetical protein